MTKVVKSGRQRREHGEGTIFWHEGRRRYVGVVSLGTDAQGRRRRQTFTDEKRSVVVKLVRDACRKRDAGMPLGAARDTLGALLDDFLNRGLPPSARSASSKAGYEWAVKKHITPSLGAAKLRDLEPKDIFTFLQGKVREGLSQRSIKELHRVLTVALRWAENEGRIARNVAALVDPPNASTEGRPSKSLTLAEATSLLDAAEADDSTIGAYITVSLLTGARTEELRALRWDHVTLSEECGVPPHIMVWRSVRDGGDTKTKRSRRTIALPARAVSAVERQRARQWQTGVYDLVFASEAGTALDRHNVLRAFRRVAGKAGLDPQVWTPRELRHSFVSLLSDSGVPLEHIARLVGHSSTAVTEAVYRKQLRPVLDDGAVVMDRIFGATG